MQIDITFDFRTDAGGKDPDSFSPTLRRYHQQLWSKPLPCGHMFALISRRPGTYLHHHSERGEFFLSSDSVIPTFTRWRSMRHITETFPEEENEAFRALGYTIGGMMVFPGNKVDGKQTINGARGFDRRIADRLDLTLECIRRHYLCESSPLSDTLARYHQFFALFGDFAGYVDFFLLQDLVARDFSCVNFYLPFDDFKSRSIPANIREYQTYRDNSVAFINARNKRISEQPDPTLRALGQSQLT